jgi:hypothetical protein
MRLCCAVTARATRDAPTPRVDAGRQRVIRASSSADAAETPARVPKRPRRELALLGFTACATLAPDSARGGDASSSTSSSIASSSTFSVETRAFRVANVPSFYEEVDLGASAAAASSETFLRDSRFGLAGNVIQLSSQTASSGGPRSLGDIGTAETVAKRLVEAENAKSRGRAAATLRRVDTRTTAGVDYYDIVYEKIIAAVPRVVQTTLALDAKPNGSSTLYTLAVETDRGRYDADEAAFRAIAEGFTVFPE